MTETNRVHRALLKLSFRVSVDEVRTGEAGRSTERALREFQRRHGLTATGRLDEPTRAALSDQLAVQVSEVHGLVRDADGAPLKATLVRAVDKALRSERTLGEAHTDETGRYRIAYKAAEEAAPGLEPVEVNLVVRALGPRGKVLAESALLFDAAASAEVDLGPGPADGPGPSQLDRLHAALSTKLDGASLAALEPEELSFLAGAAKASPRDVETLAAAQKLAAAASIPAPIAFALARQDLPTDLAGLAMVSGADLRRAVESAVGSNVIGDQSSEAVDKALASLRTAATAEALKTGVLGAGSLGGLLGASSASTAQQQRLLELNADHQGTPEDFWTKVAADPLFKSGAVVADLQFALQAGALTFNHAPLVSALQSMRKSKKISGFRDLARLTVADWKALIVGEGKAAGTGVPAAIAGASDAARAQTYAETLARIVEDAAPTAAIAARLPASAAPQKEAVAAFLDRNPGFDFATSLVDRYLADNPKAAAGSDGAQIATALKTYQRIFRLTSRLGEMEPLLADGLHSALDVTRLGQSAFVGKYADAMGGPDRATMVYRQAEHRVATAAHLYASHNAAYQSPALAALPQPGAAPAGPPPNQSGPAPPPKKTSLVAEVPDLATLFGAMDFCDCVDCRSVLSPAAYLVDLLHFLAKRPAKPPAVHAKDVLFDRRRGDLGQIELSCENTNTPVPYVDLVNELLEDAVAPRGFVVSAALKPDLDARNVTTSVAKTFATAGYPLSASATIRVTTAGSAWTVVNPGWRHVVTAAGSGLWVSPYPQTSASPEEAAANPEHLNGAAYDVVGQAIYPWGLPLALWTETVRAYLGPFAVTRADLMAALAPAGPPPAAAIAEASERLGMTPLERKLIAGKSSFQTSECWGFSSSPPANWVDQVSAAPELLKRSGLAYADLLALLATGYVNPGDALSIVSIDPADPLTCVVEKLKIAGLDAAALDRIHRFVRLAAKLGWTYPDLDAVLARIGPDIADTGASFKESFVLTLSAMAQLAARTSLSLPDVLAFWYDLGVTAPPDGVCQYDSVFQNEEVVKPVDPAFALDGPELAIVAGDPPNAKIFKHVPTILASLGITSRDLDVLVADGLPDGSLNIANLSQLRRVVVLAGSASLSVAALLQLKSFSGIDPFDRTHPAATSAFLDLAGKVGSGGFTSDEIDYLVRDQLAAAAIFAPTDDAVALTLDDLYTALVKIAVPSPAAPPEDPTGAATRDALQRLPDWPPDRVDDAFDIVSGASAKSVGDQDTFIDTYFGQFVDPSDAKAKLVGPPATLIDPAARFSYALLNLRRTSGLAARRNQVVQKLAKSVKLDAAALKPLLTGSLVSVNSPPDPMIADFLALADIVKADAKTQLTPAQCAVQIMAYGRLAKAALVISRLAIRSDEIGWYAAYAPTAGWLDFNALPTSPQPTAGGLFNALVRTLDLCSLRDSIPGKGTTLGDLFALARAAGSTRLQVLVRIAQATGWTLDDVTFVAGPNALNLAFPADFEDERGLGRLYAAMALVTRIGSPGAQAAAWAAADPVEADARAIVQALRARYGDSWTDSAKPLRDALREKQRAALVAFLTPRADATKNQAWTDAYGLYQHFLIDVEMTCCQLTSRIKQAIGSVQLFAQRARLNLEPLIEVDDLTDVAWREWAWMKNYRVWEANRQVFLFPENWIEPSLRDDKTPFFLDLENQLLKNDITSDRAEDAYIKYLEALNEVARLEIVASFHEYGVDSQGAPIVDTRHVFGRTYAGDPHKYFYRKRIDGRYWTPWEKVDVDISGDHLIPSVVDGRLSIYWPIFTQTPANQAVTMPNPGSQLDQQEVYWDIKMAWSEYRHKAWSAKKISSASLSFPTNAVTQDLLSSTYAPSLFTFRAVPDTSTTMIKCAFQQDPTPVPG
jgi:hypothetical protein